MSFRSVGLSVFAALSVSLSGSMLCAGPLQKSRVAADAQWLGHVDVQGLASSKLIQVMMEHGHDIHADIDLDMADLNGFEEQFGLDPLKDIIDVTFYGTGNPETESKFVAIFTTTAAVDELLESLKTEAPGYKEFEAGGVAVRSIDEEGNDGKVFFHVRSGGTTDHRTVVVSKDVETLVRAVGLVAGKGSNLAAAPNPAMTHSPRPGSLIFAAAQGLPWLEGDDDDPSSALVRDAESMVFDYGEAGDETYWHAGLTTRQAEDAVNVADMVRGLLAMGKMAAASEPDLAPFKATLQAVKITSEGKTITIDLRQRTDELVEALKAADTADGGEEGEEDDDADDDE